jgi:KDO2-lipid IV(A) lauroyltransferase
VKSNYGMKNYLEFIVFKFFVLLARLLPFKIVQRLGKLFGIFMFNFIPYRKKVALENLKKSFPEKSDEEIRRILKLAYVNLGITFFEFMGFANLKISDFDGFVKLENFDVVVEALKKGKGLILMSGHFGNWELSAIATGIKIGKPLNVIVKKQRNKFVDREINKWRCWFGNKVIPMEKAFRESLRILSEGGIVALLADQSAPKEGLYVNFLGRPASTFTGPAIMSIRTGAPIVVGFAIREENYGYRIVFEKIDFTPSENEDENIIKLTQLHTSMLEKYIRLYPDHWLWFHRRWKHQPPSEMR